MKKWQSWRSRIEENSEHCGKLEKNYNHFCGKALKQWKVNEGCYSHKKGHFGLFLPQNIAESF
jgi:hypothetical protein